MMIPPIVSKEVCLQELYAAGAVAIRSYMGSKSYKNRLFSSFIKAMNKLEETYNLKHKKTLEEFQQEYIKTSSYSISIEAQIELGRASYEKQQELLVWEIRKRSKKKEIHCFDLVDSPNCSPNFDLVDEKGVFSARWVESLLCSSYGSTTLTKDEKILWKGALYYFAHGKETISSKQREIIDNLQNDYTLFKLQLGHGCVLAGGRSPYGRIASAAMAYTKFLSTRKTSNTEKIVTEVCCNVFSFCEDGRSPDSDTTVSLKEAKEKLRNIKQSIEQLDKKLGIYKQFIKLKEEIGQNKLNNRDAISRLFLSLEKQELPTIDLAIMQKETFENIHNDGRVFYGIDKGFKLFREEYMSSNNIMADMSHVNYKTLEIFCSHIEKLIPFLSNSNNCAINKTLPDMVLTNLESKNENNKTDPDGALANRFAKISFEQKEATNAPKLHPVIPGTRKELTRRSFTVQDSDREKRAAQLKSQPGSPRMREEALRSFPTKMVSQSQPITPRSKKELTRSFTIQDQDESKKFQSQTRSQPLSPRARERPMNVQPPDEKKESKNHQKSLSVISKSRRRPVQLPEVSVSVKPTEIPKKQPLGEIQAIQEIFVEIEQLALKILDISNKYAPLYEKEAY